MTGADVQQGITVDLVLRYGLSVRDIHATFLHMGGMMPERDVRCYLEGSMTALQLQRDLVAHAVNEQLSTFHPRAGSQRAPYSSAEVAEASGYARSEFDGERLAEHSRGTQEGLCAMSRDAEAERLASLRRSGLLVKPSTASLERVPRLARDYFGVLGAAITLITRDELVTKSMAGAQGHTVPRRGTFCNETIRFDRTLVIPDTRRDSQWADNPHVVGAPHIRFYAGHPIQGPGDLRVGSLCILDDSPRTFSSGDERKLRTLAALVQLEIWTPEDTEVPTASPTSATGAVRRPPR